MTQLLVPYLNLWTICSLLSILCRLVETGGVSTLAPAFRALLSNREMAFP